MDFGFTTAAYVVAAILFILSLGGLSGQESAKRAVWYGIVGMALAVAATLIGPGAGFWLLSLILIAGGGALVNVGGADEAAADQRLGAIELRLGELGVRPRNLDLGGERAHLLALHRTCNRRERLTRLHPVARLNQNAADHAAFADALWDLQH